MTDNAQTPGGLPPVVITRKDGKEQFHAGGRLLGFDLRGFWQWSASDLVNNTTRGIIAEYLVARALGLDGGVREPWQAYDLQAADGVKVEVKSSAHIQSWHQDRLSKIVFKVAPTRKNRRNSDCPQIMA